MTLLHETLSAEVFQAGDRVRISDPCKDWHRGKCHTLDPNGTKIDLVDAQKLMVIGHQDGECQVGLFIGSANFLLVPPDDLEPIGMSLAEWCADEKISFAVVRN